MFVLQQIRYLHSAVPNKKWLMYKVEYHIKGALDNFSLIPNFFFKKVEIFISLEVYTYVVTAC